ncbi:MAG TPA: GlsB/YeaQ/YmgE family stress response membrane protein [Anaerolineae bacterium]|nr:GlsB/YeaQ/YmgE family stress response membrane protein [Anaerolineae bacterium]
MGIIAWIIVGGLAGWIASLIMRTDERMGCILNVIVGIVGAFVGGLVVQLLTGQGFDFEFNITSLLVAIVGAVILLFIVGLFRRGRPV